MRAYLYIAALCAVLAGLGGIYFKGRVDGERAALVRTVKKEDAAIGKAIKARDGVRVQCSLSDAECLHDDGFKRPE